MVEKDKFGVLALPQREINRQFYKMLTEAEAGDASAIKALADKIGSETTANTILKRIKDVETAIGSESTSNTMLKRIKDIETAIGTESTEGTILARIKALEDAS